MPSEWEQLFGTNDVVAATNYLAALGVHNMCDQGMRCDVGEGAPRGSTLRD